MAKQCDYQSIVMINSMLRYNHRVEFSDNLLVHRELKTGEGFCNIDKYWKNEGLKKDLKGDTL